MTTTPAPAHLRRRLTCAIAAVAVALVAGCATNDRPTFSVWNERWSEVQLLVPTEHELVEEGRPYCDRLLGELRTALTDLTPTPSESVDPTFETWSDHVRTLAFECPADPTEIAGALSTIHQLEAEIAAASP